MPPPDGPENPFHDEPPANPDDGRPSASIARRGA